jgi:hypothetical protein
MTDNELKREADSLAVNIRAVFRLRGISLVVNFAFTKQARNEFIFFQ